jgi:ADP-ribose pyrophosphatase
MSSAEIEQIGTRVVYENRWMRVREDRTRRRDGKEGIYGVVEKVDFCVIAAIDQGHIYLVEQYRYPVGARFWELPQGSWEDRPEVDACAVARAELKEETGLTAQSMTHVAHLFLAYGFSTQGYHVYLASNLELGEPALEDDEQGLVARAFALEDVERMVCDGRIKDATTVAVLGLLRLKGMTLP